MHPIPVLAAFFTMLVLWAYGRWIERADRMSGVVLAVGTFGLFQSISALTETN